MHKCYYYSHSATFSEKTLNCSPWHEETELLCAFEYHGFIVYLKNFKQVAARSITDHTHGARTSEKTLKCSPWHEETKSLCAFKYHVI